MVGVKQAVSCLKAERDENIQRKDFAPSEAVAMGVKLEALEKPLKAKQSAGGKKAGRGRKIGVGKLPTPDRHVREKVGSAVGMSGRIFVLAFFRAMPMMASVFMVVNISAVRKRSDDPQWRFHIRKIPSTSDSLPVHHR